MQRILNNWELKLTALILAVALWAHVRGEVNPFETATYAVHLNSDFPEHLRLAKGSEIPKEVRVTLRAPRSVFRQINGLLPPLPLGNPEDAKPLPQKYGTVRLDFTLARPGKQEIPVRSDIRVPNAEELGLNPSNVALVLEKR